MSRRLEKERGSPQFFKLFFNAGLKIRVEKRKNLLLYTMFLAGHGGKGGGVWGGGE